MASLDYKESGSALADGNNKETQGSSNLQGRMSAVESRARQFMQTLTRTKASSSKEIDDLKSYFAGMRLKESGRDGIRDREVFFHGDGGSEGWGIKMERDAVTLYDMFMREINVAETRKYISAESKRKWIGRFENKAIGFKAKEYWVKHQMPSFMAAWEKEKDERKKLLAHRGFDDLVSYNATFAVIKDHDEFLKLHFDKRKSILADARAALLAGNSGQLDLYADAKSKLEDAANKGILAHGKVGVWLERIFKRGKSAAQTEKFIRGAGTNDLWSLMDNWADVRKRYDDASDNFKSQGNEQLPRGIHLVSSAQFLAMHYEQRLHYVEELEKRLGSGPSLDREPASFIRVRHAIDTRDWGEAQMLIAEAKEEDLSEDARKRLDSMSNYVRQFGSKPMETINNVTRAKSRLDELLHQVPSSLQPMILRLLRNPNANRCINQFRWIVYNNKWCRTHGYLNKERAFEGANEDNKAMTKYRAEQGLDIGRHDVLDTETADQQYFRKKEFSNHKATYLHVNTDSAAPGALAQWLEHEQDPKVLYWTTFCGHENGVPNSENWHNDLFAVLTEMRSLTRTIGGGGYNYVSPNERLHSKYGSGAPSMALSL